MFYYIFNVFKIVTQFFFLQQAPVSFFCYDIRCIGTMTFVLFQFVYFLCISVDRWRRILSLLDELILLSGLCTFRQYLRHRSVILIFNGKLVSDFNKKKCFKNSKFLQRNTRYSNSHYFSFLLLYTILLHSVIDESI